MQLQIFQNSGYQIRGGLINNEPYFVLADVCKALDITNPSMTIQQLDEDERAKLDLGRQGEAWTVTESGLYRIIMRSDKPQAKPFQKWVTGEVLPSIRKHGIYATPQTIEDMIANPDFAIELLQTLKTEREARIEAERRNAVLMHATKTYTSTEIAKELGFKSAIALNNKLADLKIQFKQNGTWLLYSQYADLGYTDIKQKALDNGQVVYDRHWTQDGRLFILKVLGICG